MSYVYTDDGRNFFEQAIADGSFSSVIDTLAVGNGNGAPDTSDSSLDNLLYEEDDTASNVSISRGPGIGEIRATIEFTGGTEVPAGSDVSELGVKVGGTLVYREVRSSAITVTSGESKVVEIRLFVEDADDDSEQVITNVGLNFVADRAIGDSTEHVNTIAVGDATGTVDETDTTMNSELYRNTSSASNTIVATTTNVGEVRAEITLSAGTGSDDEVATDAEISEFGLISSGGTLVLHEKRPAVTLEQNDTKTFKIPFSILQ